MNYENDAEYNEAMNAYAAAESEAQMMQEHNDYLNDLIEAREFKLLAIEMSLHMLSEREFLNSGKTAHEYLSGLKKEILEPKAKENDSYELPF